MAGGEACVWRECCRAPAVNFVPGPDRATHRFGATYSLPCFYEHAGLGRSTFPVLRLAPGRSDHPLVQPPRLYRLNTQVLNGRHTLSLLSSSYIPPAGQPDVLKRYGRSRVGEQGGGVRHPKAKAKAESRSIGPGKRRPQISGRPEKVRLASVAIRSAEYPGFRPSGPGNVGIQVSQVPLPVVTVIDDPVPRPTLAAPRAKSARRGWR